MRVIHIAITEEMEIKKCKQNKVTYSVLAQNQNIIINTIVFATCYGFCQLSSGLCLLYGGITPYIKVLKSVK